ncbi:MAG: TonB-dependent receptor [Cyclobacteriaceae bacterium]
MMKKIYKLLRSSITLIAVMAVLTGYAQDQTVTGRVTSDDSPEGLPGVTVLIKGTTTGTITDIDGNYRISASSDDILTFSFIGFELSEAPVNGRSVIDVKMEYDLEQLDEVVVIGYGEQNRRDVTGSIVSVKADALAQSTPVSALEGMRGRLSGVNITANGAPGEAADIKIRGTSTLNAGTGPLYVVDGQQLDNIDNLNPDDIASVEVLKDGSSAAIYGSKSANGVIIVTTKKGKSGETKIDASYIRSYTSLATKIPVSNTRQARQYEIARNGNLDAQSAATPSDSLSQLFNQDYDYQELITRLGVRDQLGLSLSGGTEDANFYWNTGYLQQEGVVKNSFYNRFNSTLNVNFKVRDKINAGTRLMVSFAERNGLNEGAVFGQLSTHFPYLPYRDTDGTYVGQTSSQQNVVAETIFTERIRRDFDGQVFNFLEYQILPSLKFKTTLGLIYELRRDNDFNPSIVQARGAAASGNEITRLNFSMQQENYLTWRQKFGDHNVSLLAGTQFQTWKNETSRLEAIAFNNDLISTFNNVSAENIAATSSETAHALVSQYARATYDYKGKYLFAATVRRDGSSRFGTENQYGIFPAASVGWRVSDEAFMTPLTSVLSDFKLRASYAQNGNERIGNFDSRSLYSPGANYNGLNGISQTQLGNPNLVWENTTQINYGVDLGLFGGKITATVDVYSKVTDDLLYDTPLPPETGFTQITNNIGKIENRGVELFLSGSPIDNKDFQWFTSFNIATNENEILDLAEKDGQFLQNYYIYQEGGSIGDFHGYTVEGVFAYDESNAFDNDGNQLTPIFDEDGAFVNYELNGSEYSGDINQITFQGVPLKGGNVHWKDHNGDFEIDPINDRTVIGQGVPKFFGGFYNEFKYKGIKLSILFDYNFGNDIYRRYDEIRNQRMVRTVLPGPDRIDNAWYKPGDVAQYPSLWSSEAARNNFLGNSYWVDDADFIKLRSVRIDYTFPKDIVSKTGILSNVSIYASGNNLLTWTNYAGYNPELGSRGNALSPGLDNLRYPLSREYILGLKATF